MFDRVTRNPWVRFAAFLLALLVAIWLVYLIRDIVLPFVLALVVAYVLDPLVDFLEARKMSRSFAIFTLIAVLVLALLAVALITVQPLIRQANEKLPLLAENAEKLIDKGLEMARDLRRKPAAPPAPEEQPPPPGTDGPAEKPTPAPAEPAPPAEPEPEADDAQEILSGAVRELVTKLQSHVSTIAQTVATGIAAAIGKIFSTFLAIFNLVVFAVVTVYLLKDIDNLRERFPTLEIFLGPEIHAGLRIDIQCIPQGVADISDYFLVSLPTDHTSVDANTEARVSQIHAITNIREHTGRPVFVAHPFRTAVNNRLVKRSIPPWVTVLAPRSPREFKDSEVNEFFGFDVRALGRACRECDLTVEVNGGTDSRIRGLNLPAPLQMYWASYLILKEEGVTFAPGSDQHAYMRTPTRREGRYVPFDAFAALEVRVEDMPLVGKLLTA